MAEAALKIVGACAAAALVAACADLVRTYLAIRAPRKPPSAADLGLPESGFSTLANARDVAAGCGACMTGMGGRRLRRCLLYRSAKLHGIGQGDKELLRQLGIRLIADFRSAEEATREPDSWLPDHVVQHKLYEAADGDPHAMAKQAIREGIIPGQAERMLKDMNRGFATIHAPKFRAFLEDVAKADGLPVLVHCTAGKDRTGWAVALLLSILGVEEEAVMEDYLLSNALYYKVARKYAVFIRLFSRFRVDANEARPLLVVHRDFLSEAIGAARASHGSLAKYVTAPDGLGLSADVVDKLRDLFLE